MIKEEEEPGRPEEILWIVAAMMRILPTGTAFSLSHDVCCLLREALLP